MLHPPSRLSLGAAALCLSLSTGGCLTSGGDCTVSNTCADGGVAAGGATGTGGNGGTGGEGGIEDLGGVCNSEMSAGPEHLDVCLTASCCAAYDACRADTPCRLCLMNVGIDCSSLALFQTYTSCSASNCPDGVCGSEISISKPNSAPDYACMVCASANCCPDLSMCLQGATPAEISVCNNCLGNPTGTSCMNAAPAVQQGASDFIACRGTNCSGICL